MDDSNSVLIKLGRTENILSVKSEEISGAVTALTKNLQALTIEVEELKNFRHVLSQEIPAVVEASVARACSKEIPEGVAQSLGAIQKIINDQVNTMSQEALKSKQGLDIAVSKATQLLNKEASRITQKGVLVIASIVLSVLITSAGIGYFFPRYMNIQNTVSSQDLLSLWAGEAFYLSKDKLPKKYQDIIITKMEEILSEKYAKYRPSPQYSK